MTEFRDNDSTSFLTIEGMEIMTEIEMLKQDEYMNYQDFITNYLKLNLGDLAIVYVLWNSELELDGHENFEKSLKANSKEYYESIYVRQGEQYKIISFSFDKKGIINVSEPSDVENLDEIIAIANAEQWLGNPEEYIRFLKSQGMDKEAQLAQRKYEYFIKNRHRISEITKSKEVVEDGVDEITMLAALLYSENYDNEIGTGFFVNDEGRIILPGEEQSDNNGVQNEDFQDDSCVKYETIIYKGLDIDNLAIVDKFGRILPSIPEEIISDLEKAIESGELVLTEAQKNTLSIYIKPKVTATDFAQVAETSIGEKDKVQKAMGALVTPNRGPNKKKLDTNGEGGEQADDN